MPDRANTAVLILIANIMAAGCGQKGPLYLPGDPSRIQTTIPTQTTGESEQEQEERNEDRDDDSGRQL